MAQIHILGGGNNTYQIVVHATTPVGTNDAGVLWTEAIKNSGKAKSILTVGNGAGQITNNEMNQVTAGTIVEATTIWQDDPLWTQAQRDADLSLRAAQAVAEVIANLQAELKFFGKTFNG